MVMLTLMQKMGLEPIFCICVLLPLLLIIFEKVNVVVDTKCEWAFKIRANVQRSQKRLL